MTRWVVGLAGALVASGPLLAPKTTKPPKPPARVWPEGPPPKGLSIARTSVAFRGDRVMVSTDLTWPSRPAPETFTVHVAYGAPGTPRAFDTELLAVPRDRFAPEAEAHGAALPASHEPRAPDAAALSLGPRGFAGQTIIVAGDVERALDGEQRALRVRAVHDLAPGAKKSVLVRIGPPDASLPLGPIIVTVDDKPATDATATLCDRGSRVPVALPGQIGAPSPARVSRQPGESLCVELGR